MTLFDYITPLWEILNWTTDVIRDKSLITGGIAFTTEREAQRAQLYLKAKGIKVGLLTDDSFNLWDMINPFSTTKEAKWHLSVPQQQEQLARFLLTEALIDYWG